MPCCGVEEDEKKAAIFKKKDRGCTDILCLASIILMWVAMFIVALISIKYGKPDTFIYPTDYNGNYCGKKGGDVAGRKYGFFPLLDKDIHNQMGTLLAGQWWNFKPYTVCVEECPGSFNLDSQKKYGGPDYPGYSDSTEATINPCKEGCYNAFKTTAIANRCFPTVETAGITDRHLCGNPHCGNVTAFPPPMPVPQCLTGTKAVAGAPHAWEMQPGNDAQAEICELKVLETTQKRYLPDGTDDDTYGYMQKIAKNVQSLDAVFDSIYHASTQVILLGIAAPVAFGFVWTLFLGLFAGVIVYVSLTIFVLCLLIGTCWLYIKAGWASDVGIDISDLYNNTLVQAAKVDTTIYAVAAVIATLLTLLVILLIFGWRKMIGRAIAIIQESCKVFRAVPFLMVYPLGTIFWLAAFAVYFVMIGAFISTLNATSYEAVAKEIESHNVTFDGIGDFTMPDHTSKKVICYLVHILGVLWTFNFIYAIGWTTQSGTVCAWFFSHETTEPPVSFGFGCSTVWASYGRVFRYHLGSMAFGALILALAQFVRMILATVDYYTRDLQKSNTLLKLVIKCSQCFMWCLEKTIQFVTNYGYIFVALEGDGFCHACWETFKLIVANPAQVTVNATVTALVSLIISLTTPTACALITFTWLENSNAAWPIYPAVLVWIIAYMIASAICSALKCTIDTVFLCAFKDMEENKPTPKFMSDDLREGFGIDKAEEDLTKSGMKPRRSVRKGEDGRYSTAQVSDVRLNTDPELTAN
jgi:hypothetical protein